MFEHPNAHVHGHDEHHDASSFVEINHEPENEEEKDKGCCEKFNNACHNFHTKYLCNWLIYNYCPHKQQADD